jgi:DNA-binding HxlR family transcriptional regulator
MACSIARTLDVVGEPWTPLIMRDIFVGINRFELMREDLGIPRQTLASRLEVLVDRGVVDRVSYQKQPERFEYALTESGKELAIALLALMTWGDKWRDGGAGPPARLTHTACGHEMDPEIVCDQCGERLVAEEIAVAIGRGARGGFGTKLMGSAILGTPPIGDG